MSFQNIKLLECNREQSVEKNNDSNENAIFTNRLGEVVELNPGDQISLQSAFINKRGTANLNSIEFKGKSLGVTGKFIQTSTATTSPTEWAEDNKYPEIKFYTDYTSNLQSASDPRPNQENIPQNNIAFRQIYNEEIVKDLKDNELHLETVFYKTTNGENYAVMPKNYIRTSLHELDGNVDNGKTQSFVLLGPEKYLDSQYFNRPDHDVDTFLYPATNPSTGAIVNFPIYMKGLMSGVSRYAPNTYIGMGEQMGIYNYIDSFCSADYRRVQQIVGYGTYDSTTYPSATDPPSDTTYFGQSFDSTKGSGQIIVAPNRLISSFIPDANPPVASDNDKRINGTYYEDIRAVQENERFTLFEREYDWLMYPQDIVDNPTTGYSPGPEPNYVFYPSDGTSETTINGSLWFQDARGSPDTQNLPDTFPKRFIRLFCRSPALYPYLKRSKVNTITLNKGYSTPQSIAEQITEQLQRQDTDSPYIYEKTINTDRTNSGTPNYGNQQQKPSYSTAFQTRFFEPIDCANRLTFSCDNYYDYFDLDQSVYGSEKAFNWWKSFHNMYFKRPELYEAGTKVNYATGYLNSFQQQLNPTENNPGLYENPTNHEIDNQVRNHIWNTIPITDSTFNNNYGDYIVTSWIYTKQNLENLQNLFDEQAKHPELFFDETKDGSWNYPFMNKHTDKDGDVQYLTNATIDNSRFLHINRFDINAIVYPTQYDGGNMFFILGDDGFRKLTYDNGLTGANKRTYDTDHRAVPVFFKYDKTYRNVDTGGTNTNNLSYGFATKEARIVDGISYDFIVLHPELVNGIRSDVFNMRGGQKPFTQTDTTFFTDVAEWEAKEISGLDDQGANYTIIGWDRHYTSWGQMAIMETTGQSPVSYDGLATPTAIGPGIPYTRPLTEPGGTIATVSIYQAGSGYTPGPSTGNEIIPRKINPDGSIGGYSTGDGAQFSIVVGATGTITSATIIDGGTGYKTGDALQVVGSATDNGYLKITSTTTIYTDSGTPVIEMAYAGTNNIACVYDQVSNKFGFEYLHMPEFVGNEYNAGITDYITTTEGSSGDVAYNIPINDSAGNEVYKINKRLKKLAFCPDMTPYMDMTATIQTNYSSGNPGETRIDPMNNAFSPWVIYDSKGGVAINFGKSAKIDETISSISQAEAWNNSVLGILGYSYEQFNPEVITAKNTYQGRLTSNNLNSVFFPTTNGELLTSDTDTYYMNPFGAVLYTNQLPTCLDLQLTKPSTYNDGDGFTLTWHYLPSIVKPTKSMKLEGVNLPRVTLNPYMTIRSDLITHKKYIGGSNSGLTLPIIAIVQKINADKDYLETSVGEVFTVTEPMKFSSITTAICDPDGTLSLLDQGSAVIYKIAKNDNMDNYSFLEDFKKKLKK
tara:strand:+ start:3605 stop:7720 length:4116 start_codon:yes stop_codon:yes gene_type:complete